MSSKIQLTNSASLGRPVTDTYIGSETVDLFSRAILRLNTYSDKRLTRECNFKWKSAETQKETDKPDPIRVLQGMLPFRVRPELPENGTTSVTDGSHISESLNSSSSLSGITEKVDLISETASTADLGRHWAYSKKHGAPNSSDKLGTESASSQSIIASPGGRFLDRDSLLGMLTTLKKTDRISEFSRKKDESVGVESAVFPVVSGTRQTVNVDTSALLAEKQRQGEPTFTHPQWVPEPVELQNSSSAPHSGSQYVFSSWGKSHTVNLMVSTDGPAIRLKPSNVEVESALKSSEKKDAAWIIEAAAEPDDRSGLRRRYKPEQEEPAE
ncbi:hypothetical protein RGU70_08545 [Herbaspirillum sp. RTI4]|uniref:SpaN/EivJ family type III secretion system needle length determinant n=1 Tax=Herbaspirillum sp. RTI4 TaxID=3048640 RepID=UPI002AB504DD|nr:hypothetical protein [Herbaspirillum sp. RTI4]MDY7578369.1 hypothetical protein [Herbaspirillum sp. RTI4]MEA9983515.1 hypothetical protein [Herbaspirillum sp. RTI4]